MKLVLPEDCGKGVPLLVCVSGGADSVCLLLALLEAGRRCVVAHCNFHLRGEESERDERFVTSLAARLKVSMVRKDFDTTGYAAAKGLSIEMAARELRYEWFEEERVRQGCRYTAVAHNLNDQVETFMLNLTRGTGIKGLTGIRAVNGSVIRPLRNTTREEIEQWLAERGQEYVTDSTNSDTKYRRNRIRHNILPEFVRMNPSFMQTMLETMENLAAAEAAIEEPESAEARRQELYTMLSRHGFTHDRIVQVWQAEQTGASGKRFEQGGVTVVVDRGKARVHIREEEKEMGFSIEEVERGEMMKSGDRYAFLDGEKVKMPLRIRRWEEGEWFVPYGMKGRKKVSDYLTERRLDVVEKKRQRVMVDAEGRIVWVIGQRTDGRFAVDNKTVRVVKVTVWKKC